MKRNLILALVLVLALSTLLVSCSSENKESVEPTKETKETKEEPKEEMKEEPKEEAQADDHIIKLGHPIVMGDFEINVQSFDVVEDYEGKPLLRITYDWKNNSDKEMMSMMAFSFTGYQDGVETDMAIAISDDINLEPSQKNVQPGYGQEGVHDVLSIDPSKPMQIKLSELMNLSDEAWTYEFTAQ